ncbi:hypothetical protein [Streptomyces lycii]|uniref:Secreted protein n=1 Tax=Streptomyces lycii TaxID=2654337 RepID=A0ABQ7FFC7_9ACTN|nr:hypothetical protein [Streptomyces lycii]KAF4407030.1 hypothetical protein GCU69_21820 [Streptomyces lycii]
MEAAIAVVALLFVLFVAAGVYAAAKAVGAAKRGVDRTVAQARRTVEDTTLRARQLAQPGAAGELAELRIKLRTSMRATQDTLHAAAPDDSSLGETLGLFERLSTHGRELDDELKRLEREPDKSRVAAALPDLRERTERVVHSADSLRWAAQDRARRFADDDLAALSSDIQLEAGALRHWDSTPGTTDAAGSGSTGGAQRSPDPGQARQAEARTAPAGEPAGTPDRTPDRERQPEEPPALTARDPRQRTGFPWEKAGKTRRPESTA